MLRSCRFLASIVQRWREAVRPQKEMVVREVKASLVALEESQSWAGRESSVEQKVKSDLARSVSEIISSFSDVHAEAERNRDELERQSKQSIQEIIASIRVVNARAEEHRNELDARAESRMKKLEASVQEQVAQMERRVEEILKAAEAQTKKS